MHIIVVYPSSIIFSSFLEIDHLRDVLKISSRDGDDIGVRPWEGVRSNEGGEGRIEKGGGGEHSVKQFMNIKVKSSKEEVKVHAKNELVSWNDETK